MIYPSWIPLQRRKKISPTVAFGRGDGRAGKERRRVALSFPVTCIALSALALATTSLVLRIEQDYPLFKAVEEPVPRGKTSDLWILFFSRRDDLLFAYRRVAHIESEIGNTEYEVFFARDATEFRQACQRVNRRERVYSLFILSHASAGMLSYTSNGVDDRVDPSDLPGGKIGPGGIGPWTDVWFYGCRFADDDLTTSAPDWLDTGRIWSRYLNGARIWGNTGWVNLNTLNGTGRWMHYQEVVAKAERAQNP